MKYLCAVLGLMFVLFTYWQFNDLTQYKTQGWYFWVAAYALCALVCLVSMIKRLPLFVYLGMALAALVAAVVRVQDIEWSGKLLYNENNPSANETGGLLIIAICMGILAWQRKRLGCCCKK